MTTLDHCVIEVEIPVFTTDRWVEVIEWLKQNIEYNSWRYMGIKTLATDYVRIFMFKNETDAAMFVLRWA